MKRMLPEQMHKYILEIGKTLTQFMGGGEKCDPKLVGGQLPQGGGAHKTLNTLYVPSPAVANYGDTLATP